MTASNEQDSTIDFLEKLLNSGGDSTGGYVTDAQRFNKESNQRGPLRYFDQTMRCTSRRCGSATHYKFRGMPLCTVHAMKRMNEELTDEDE
jgi:hypothetical protein